MINPMLVEGQLHGGIAMGVGQALIENIVYQGDQIVTGSFMDYGMPRADNFCHFVAGENEVPTKINPLGVKGAGEFGTVGALPAVMNAVNDALARIGAPYVGCRRRRRRCGGRSRRREETQFALPASQRHPACVAAPAALPGLGHVLPGS